MRCAKCGQELSDGTRFCPYCGEKVTAGPAPGDEAPLYQVEVKGLLRSGMLYVYPDRTEFVVSSVQKMTFRYAELAALRLGLDRINFIMGDGRTESCAVNRKNLHEAYYTIEQAARPYLAERRQRLLAQGVRFSFPSSRQDLSGMLNSGLLEILNDRCEYRAAAGKSETIAYPEVKSVRLSGMGALEFTFYDGTKRAFTADKEQREAVVAYLREALLPFQEERRQRLLEQGIRFSFVNSPAYGKGVFNICNDRLVYRAEAGQEDTVGFERIRTVHVYDGTLEVGLTDGTMRQFAIDRDAQNEVQTFLTEAIAPYVRRRTEGFDLRFGSDETLEINEERGVFHVLRQNGREISEEYPLADLTGAEATEGRAGRVLANALLLARGGDAAAREPEERIADLGVLLTVRMEQGADDVPVRLESFPFGVGRADPEYTRKLAELDRLFAWLGEHCPDCAAAPLPAPAAPRETPAAPAPAPEPDPAATAEHAPATLTVRAEGHAGTVGGVEKSQFGTLVDGIVSYIGQCGTPMAIAIQGDWETGRDSFLYMVYHSLAQTGRGEALWLNTWQLSQLDLGDRLPLWLADKLSELLGGIVGEETRTRAKMMAQGMIGLVTGIISKGTSDGQKLSEAIFRDDPANSLEQRVARFNELVKHRAGDGGKVTIFVDDLNRLPPAKTAALLDALRYFRDCPGCVFVAAVDREMALRGKQELSGAALGEQAAEAWFDKMFKISFRVPQSSFDVLKYIRDNLSRMDIHPDDDAEMRRYAQLAQLSVGGDPKALERTFNSFFLLKNVAGAAAFASAQGRLTRFALVCMQNRFPGVYRCLLEQREQVTPQLLGDLETGSPLESQAGLSAAEAQAFRAFGGALGAVASAQGAAPGEQDCRAFAAALADSAITAFR